MIYDNEILPKGYSIYRNDRSSRGGGILIAVDSKIPCTALLAPSAFELIAVEIGHPYLFTLCVVYVYTSVNIRQPSFRLNKVPKRLSVDCTKCGYCG